MLFVIRYYWLVIRALANQTFVCLIKYRIFKARVLRELVTAWKFCRSRNACYSQSNVSALLGNPVECNVHMAKSYDVLHNHAVLGHVHILALSLWASLNSMREKSAVKLEKRCVDILGKIIWTSDTSLKLQDA
ncbi:unnamed protein product [Albugo candida]|uniref:Uncharacterized protein n=1 Tax=Albugo candida TaxID=65357 RepID=A0A024GLZ9_9STRA|nr:unnamed protein product [Albugo candida]|eukprot:CCI47762.1 unnamed protein product [Albugo candida]